MGKEIVRQDVVQVSFDIQNSPLLDLQKDLDQIKSMIVNGLGGNVFKDFTDGAKNTTDGLKEVKEQANSLKKPFDNAKNSTDKFKESVGETAKETTKLSRFTQTFQATNRAIQDGGSKLNAFKNSIKNIPANVIDKVNAKFQSMKLTVGTTTGVLKGLTKLKLSNLKTDVTATVKALTGGEKGAKGFKKALKNIGKISVAKITTGVTKLKTNITTGITKAKTFVSSLKKINLTSLKNLDAQLTKLSTKIGSGLVSAARKAKTAILAIGTAFAGFIGAGINYNNQMEQYLISFKTMLGGSEKAANDMVGKLKTMADTTPFEMTDMASAAQTLMGFGYSADKVIPALQAIGDVSQGNAERFGSLSLAFAQVQAAGKLTGQDLLQMVNAGFNPLQIMSEKTGKSMATLKEEMSKGAISADMVTEAFMTATSEGGKFYKAMENQSKTFSGQLSTIKDNAMSLLGSLTKGIQESLAANFLPKINEKLSGLSKAFETGGFSGLLGEFGVVGSAIQNVITKVKEFASNSKTVSVFKGIFDDIKNAVGKVITFISDLTGKFIEFFGTESNINAVKRAWDAVSTAIEGIWNIATKTFGWIVDNLNWIAPIVLALVSAFVAFKTIMLGISIAVGIYNAVQWAMNAALLACPLTWIVLAIAAVIAIIVVCIVYWDKIKEVAVKCWEAIKGAWNKVADWFNTNVIQPVVNFFKGLWDKIVTIFTTVVNWVKENFVSIIAFIINPFAGVFSYLYNHCEGFRNFVNKIVTAIKNFFVNMFYFIVGVAVTIWNGIKAVWNTIATWVNTYVIQPIVNYFTVLWSRIKAIITGVWNTICTVWGIISNWVNTYIIQPVVLFFTNLWNKIVSIVTGVWNTICTIWGIIANWVNAYIIQPVIMFFTNLWTNITTIVTNIWNGICTIWGQISTWVSTNVIEPIKGFFTDLWTNLTETVGSIKEAITGAFQSAYDKVTEIWQGITGFFSNLWDGIKDTVNNLIGKGKEALGIESDVKNKGKKDGAKHAWGGLMTTPHWGQVAEDGAEMIIPLSKEKRSRGLALWQQTGNILGANTQTASGSTSTPTVSLKTYTPESGASSYYSKANNTEHNTYAPQFNLTISGTSDDRTLERKIKQWVREAMEETFEGIGRTNEVSLQEV